MGESQIKKIASAAKSAGMEWMISIKEFDSDGDGCLTFTEFRDAIDKLGIKMSREMAQYMFNYRDWSNDGVLSIAEFYDFLEGKATGAQATDLADNDGVFESDDGPGGKVKSLARAGTALEMEDF